MVYGGILLIVKNRIPYLDLQRGVSILAVILIHVTSYPVAFLPEKSLLYPFYFIINNAAHFAVPSFLFLSALVLFYQYDGRQLKWLDFYWKRLKRIIIPYLFWSLFYTAYVSYVQKASILEGVYRFFKGLLVGGSYDHLYFMIIIAQFYLVFPLLSILFRIGFIKRNLLICGAALQIAMYLLNYYEFHIQKIGTFIGSYFMYFFLGAFMANQLKKVKDNEINKSNLPLTFAFLVAGVVYIGQKWLQLTNPHWIVQPFLSNINFLTEFSYCSISCIFFLQVVQSLQNKKGIYKVIFSLGAYSFGIYFIHPFFLILWRHYVMNNGPFSYHLLVWAGGAVALILSWIFTKVITATPLGVYIVGESKIRTTNKTSFTQSS